MIKILVPTDFSANANNALKHAIEIANLMRGSITVYHVFSVPSPSGSFISMEHVMREDAEKSMNALVNKMTAQLNEGVVLEGKVIRGSAIARVCAKAEKENYQLIVMGTTGATGLKEMFIGSNAAGIMNKSKVPVLAIPKLAEFKPYDNMVLAMDDNPISNEKVVEELNLLISLFDAKLTVFHLEMEYADAGVDDSVHKYFKESQQVKVKYDFNQGIHEMIDQFAIDQAADLLCMIRRKRGVLHELFNPSITKKEVFKSSLPILILHD